MKKFVDSYNLPKFIFSIIIILLMIVASFLILKPFIIGFLWASMVVITSWPLFKKIETKCKYNKLLASVIMVLILITIFLIPFSILINSFLQNITSMIEWIKIPVNIKLPNLLFFKTIPLIGNKLYHIWQMLLTNSENIIITKLQFYFGEVTSWFIIQIINFGHFVFHLITMLIFSGLLYFKGEVLLLYIRHFVIYLAGQYGDVAILIAGQSIRAVALGIIVTSLVQSIILGIFLMFFNISYIPILTILIFFCCVAQLGPLIVMIPIIIKLFWYNNTFVATIMIVLTILIIVVDGILRPFVIKKNINLSTILIFIGVIGGVLSFGIIGLFIGPVMLAVSHNLLSSWINQFIHNNKLSK